MDSEKVIYDTDFLIALFIKDQSTHRQAKEIFEKIKTRQVFILNLVKYELATVLSRKFSYQLTKEIIDIIKNLEVSFLNFTKEEEQEIWQEFFSHQKKNISFVDCANLFLARKIKANIASFDSFYPEGIVCSLT